MSHRPAKNRSLWEFQSLVDRLLVLCNVFESLLVLIRAHRALPEHQPLIRATHTQVTALLVGGGALAHLWASRGRIKVYGS